MPQTTGVENGAEPRRQPAAEPDVGNKLNGWKGRRSDARRNHERVLAAAAEVFTEFGLGATIPQVAARAGVGKATVYRSYPTKADLVGALAQTHVDWLGDLVKRAALDAETDASAALESFLHEVVARLARDRLMVEMLSGSENLDAGEEAGAALERIFALGREQGRIRADASALDIQVLVGGFGRTLIDLDVHDPAVWQRYASLVVAGLRA